MQNQSPDNYRPETAADLISEARKIGEAILKQIRRVNGAASTFKFLLHGAPGTGKSSLAKMIAHEIAAGQDRHRNDQWPQSRQRDRPRMATQRGLRLALWRLESKADQRG